MRCRFIKDFLLSLIFGHALVELFFFFFSVFLFFFFYDCVGDLSRTDSADLLYFISSYLNGEGIPADRIKAMEWFQVAADRGYEAARKKLERMLQAEAEEEGNGGFVYRPSSDSNGSVSLPSRPPSPMFPRPVSPTTPTTSQDSYNFNATPPALPSDEPKKSRWSLGIFGSKRR